MISFEKLIRKDLGARDHWIFEFYSPKEARLSAYEFC